MKCPNCGKEFDDGSLFCNNCGTKLVEDTEEPTSAGNKTSFAEMLKSNINSKAQENTYEEYEEPELEVEKPKKHKSNALFIGIIIIAMVASTCFSIYSAFLKEKLEPDPYADAPKVNVFDDLTVWYSGYSGDATLKLEYNGKGSVWFTASKEEYLSNGETITITASIGDDKDSFLNTYGFLPESYEEEYTISGLNEYYSSLDGIAEEAMNAYKENAENHFNFLLYNNIERVATFFSVKAKDDAKYKNKLGFVYHAISDSYGKHQDYYVGFVFQNVGMQEIEETLKLTPSILGQYFEYSTLQEFKDAVVYDTVLYDTEWIDE